MSTSTSVRRVSRAVLLLWICAGLASVAAGAGTIETAGAVLETGTAPVRGVVTIDAAAPAAEAPRVPRRRPLGSIGTFTVPFPSFPHGEGGGAAFRAEASLTLAAGTHRFSTFDVDPGVVVTCAGPVTIRTGGAVSIRGEVRVDRPGALRFACGGDFTLGPDATLRTERGIVEVAALGRIEASAGASVLAHDGGVALRAHGREGVPGDAVLAGTIQSTESGAHVVQAGGSVTLSGGAAMHNPRGEFVLQAFGGDVAIADGSLSANSSGPGAIRIEAAGSVSVETSSIEAAQADVRVRAFGGGLSLSAGTSIDTVDGDMDLGARDAVSVTGPVLVRGLSGRIRLTSFTDDVRVAWSGDGGRVGGLGVDVAIVAAKGVEIRGDGDLGAESASLRIEAHAGDLSLREGPRLRSRGSLEGLASGALSADDAEFSGRSVDLVAETGRIDLTGARGVRSQLAGLRIVAAGAAFVHTPVSAFGDLSIASLASFVDVAGATIETRPPSPVADRSGSITIESFAGDAGTIDASGAVISTGSADGSSGDVALRVREGAVPPPEEGFLVADTVVVRYDTRRPGRSNLDVVGTLDTGAAALEAGPMTLRLGTDSYALELTENGGRLRASAPGIRLELARPVAGSSRSRFRLRRTGPVEELLTVDQSGPLAIGLRTGPIDADCVVRPLSGRFRRGARGEALTVPSILPLRVVARTADGAADSLRFDAEFAPLGALPATAPDLHVSFGEYAADVPAGAFVATGASVFVATDPLPGVRSVELDLVRSTLRFEATGVELGAPAGADGTVLGLTVGAERRAVRIRLGLRRGRFEY